MKWILWTAGDRALYENVIQTLHQLAPEGQGWKEFGCIELGEPYYSCPIRFVYAPKKFQDRSKPYALILVDTADVLQAEPGVPVAPVSAVQDRLQNPQELFDFLSSAH